MQYLATACASLDALLDGGLECDAITLVFGEGGSGKTNLALQCARQAAAKGLRVAYVDTEGVSTVRLRQVFSAALPQSTPELPSHDDLGAADGNLPARGSLDSEAQGQFSSQGGRDSVVPLPMDAGVAARTHASEHEGLMDKVLFFTPFTIEEQERLVQNATRVPDLGLIVVDSINMHYRLHIDGGEESEKEAARSLYKQLHHLTGFARQNQVPVLVTGQVYGGEDTTQPFARRVMEHLVKALVRFEKRPDGTRRATVIKHRSIEEGRTARFRIGPSGILPASALAARETP